jgi:hypothetical protein
MSHPKLENNIIWHNSSYNIRVGALSPAFQQHVVTLVNASFGGGQGTPVLPQTTTGACVAASYWDIGVRGDQSPSNHVVMGGTPMMLNPTDSVLSNMLDYNQNNSQGDPHLISSYCNGARTPPETPGPYARGWQVPPGISDATVPNPIFSLTPAATVDEGNNWVNMRYGPLSLTNPTAVGGLYGNYGGGLVLGNFHITTASSAAAKVTGPNLTDAPNYDFFNNPRKTGGTADAGAIALTGTTSVATVSISAPTPSLTTTPATTTPKTGTIIVTNTATGTNAGSFTLTAAPIVTKVLGLGAFSITGGTCANGTVVAPAGTCTIIVQYAPSGTTTSLAHVTITDTGVATTTQNSGNFIAN